MQTSVFLAKLIGPVLVASGIALLVSAATYRRVVDEFAASPALIMLSGVIVLPAGLVIVILHNVWTADWRVIITIIGWLCVIGGAVRLTVPDRAAEIARAMKRRMIDHALALRITAAVYVALGAILCFYGYVR